MKSTKRNSLEGFVPHAALSFCEQLQAQYAFELIITPPRKTKLGDCTIRPNQPTRITINGNLNPYSFLITYLHEVAHAIAFHRYSIYISPHGKEWQASFKGLLLSIIGMNFLPIDVASVLKIYAQKPTATTAGASNLYNTLRQYDESSNLAKKIPLLQVEQGSKFVLNGREFIKETIRRTRILCLDAKNNKRYTIPSHALVALVEQT